MEEFDAFISYRRSDVDLARAVYKLLGLFGQRVFLDVENIGLGGDWDASILIAAQRCNTMIVLWSRSAAASDYMQREWAAVKPDCRVVPVRLDGSELPGGLASRQALTGLSLGERIVARGTELTTHGKLTQSQAMAQILTELRKDGVELTPEQERGMRLFFVALRRGVAAAAVGAVTWLLARGSKTALGLPRVAGVIAGTLVAGLASGAAAAMLAQQPGGTIGTLCPEPGLDSREAATLKHSLARCELERASCKSSEQRQGDLRQELDACEARKQADTATASANCQQAVVNTRHAVQLCNQQVEQLRADGAKAAEECRARVASEGEKLAQAETEVATAKQDLVNSQQALQLCEQKREREQAALESAKRTIDALRAELNAAKAARPTPTDITASACPKDLDTCRKALGECKDSMLR